MRIDAHKLLKPTVGKVVLSVALLAASTYLAAMLWSALDYWELGFPLAFSAGGGPCPPAGGTCSSFSYVNLFADLAFWYAASAMSLSAYDAMRKKKSD